MGAEAPGRAAVVQRGGALRQRALQLCEELQHPATLEISAKGTHDPVFLRHQGPETCHSKGHK